MTGHKRFEEENGKMKGWNLIREVGWRFIQKEGKMIVCLKKIIRNNIVTYLKLYLIHISLYTHTHTRTL